MAKELSLTADQKTKVNELNLAAVEKNQAIKADASLTADQKKEAWRANHKEQRAKFKEVLTNEQLATLKAKKQEMHAKHKAKHAEHKGKAARSPKERADFRTEHMAKELSLTADQKAKVSELNRSMAEKNDQIRNDAKLTPEQKQEAFKANHETHKAKMQEILTPEQVATLRAKKEAFREKHPDKKHHQEKK